MKNFPAIFISFLLGAAISWGLCTRLNQANKVAATPPPSLSSSPSAPLSSLPPHTPTPPPINSAAFAGQWRAYHDAREKTLAAHPDLAAEYKALLGQIAAQEDALNAAMIKTDPQVAPIIAKLTAIRKQSLAPHTVPVPISPAPAPIHP